jgi:predicted glycosyltransferase
VLGLRDILDERETVMREWAAHQLPRHIAHYYDRVLVYGSRQVLDPIVEYGLPDSVAERTSFCGYVVNRKPDDDAPSFDLPDLATPSRRPVVLATAGGGADGFELLRAFTEAAAGAPWEGVLVAGPQCGGDEGLMLRRLAAEAGVAFSTFVPELARAFAAVDALVSMGGYNTLTEAAAAGIPTVCVPRTVPRTEQLIRATAFARMGLLRLVEPDRLDGRVLRVEIARALKAPRALLAGRAAASLGLDGAARAAAELLELAQTTTSARSAP